MASQELGTVIRPDEAGYAATQEQVGRGFQHVPRGKLPPGPDQQVLPRVLIRNVQDPQRSAVIGAVVTKSYDQKWSRWARRSRTHGPSWSHNRCFFGCRCGTLSPSRRQRRSTRLRSPVGRRPVARGIHALCLPEATCRRAAIHRIYQTGPASRPRWSSVWSLLPAWRPVRTVAAAVRGLGSRLKFAWIGSLAALDSHGD